MRIKKMHAMFYVLCALSALPCQQIYNENHSFSVLKTNHFDFIFPPESEQSARFLARYADGMYDRLCSYCGIDVTDRLPVAFTADTESLNAYYSSAGHNHIILFDTIPSDGELLFDDHLLTVFYHELTHAFTALCRSRGWSVLSAVLGDCVSPALVAKFPPVFSEGFAVAFESMTGQGRTHDPYVRQYVLQAKANGSYPCWADVAGAADMYGSGDLPYYFGGMFCDYLRSTYGIEKLGEFMRTGGYYVKGGTLYQRFKTVFGVSLEDAWNAAADALPLLQLNEWVQAYQEPETRDITAIAAVDGSCFSGAVFYDALHSSVYAASAQSGTIAVSRLFGYAPPVAKLALSRSGRYLVISGSERTSAGSVNTLRLYDMQQRTFLPWVQEHFREGVFVTLTDGSEVLCAIRTERQKLTAVLFSGSQFTEEQTVLTFSAGTYVANLCPGEDGYVSYLSRCGLNRAIETLAVDSSLSDFAAATCVADGIPYIRYLSSVQNRGTVQYVFAWSGIDTLYRFGMTEPDGTVTLQTADIDGGVHMPVRYKDYVMYTAQFGAHNALVSAPVRTIPKNSAGQIESIAGDYGVPLKTLFVDSSIDYPVSTYNPLKSLFNVCFLPFAVPASNSRSSVMPVAYIAGLDSTERYHLALNVAYDTGYMFAEYDASIKYTSLPVTFQLSASDSLSEQKINTSIYTRRKSQYVLSSSWCTYAGRMNTEFSGSFAGGCMLQYNGYEHSVESAYQLPFIQSSSAAFISQNLSVSHTQKKGIGAFSYQNVCVSLFAQECYFFERTLTDGRYLGIAEGVFSCHFPGILPVDVVYPVCFTFPLTVSISSAWSAGRRNMLTYDGNNAFSYGKSYSTDTIYNQLSGDMVSGGRVSVLLCGIDIQKSFGFGYLYVNRVTISAEYGCYGFWSYARFAQPQKADYVAGVAGLQLSPILGGATGYLFVIESRFEYGITSNLFRIYLGGKIKI